ncbi:MAG: GxxExxY protein [Candidatus Marinimicrobia bacterium]|nr:GxxExxY protein [Candidatus Neomarinimicrobiota bacterium]
MVGLTENQLSEKIIGAAIEVHRELGPGLLESVYEAALFVELHERGIQTQRQVPVEAIYKGKKLEVGFRIDLLVEDKVIIELKTVEKITDVHLAQILTYLKLSERKLGMILNFNVKYLKDGIKRVVNNL